VLRGRCGLFALGDLVADGAHDRGVAHGTVVDGRAVDDGDGIEQAATLDLGDDLGELTADIGVLSVVVGNDDLIAEAALELFANDGRDLLRRPRGASTAGEARGLRGDVEDVDLDGLGHGVLLQMVESSLAELDCAHGAHADAGAA